MINAHHRQQYREARKTRGPALIRTCGLHGLSDEALAELEYEYIRTTPYASCKWCGVETNVPKKKAHALGVACSEDCEREIEEHYT